MSQKVFSATYHGLTPFTIEIEVSWIFGKPQLVIIGLPTKSIDEAKERITASLVSCGIKIIAKKTVINLAPADMRKNGSALELGMAIAIAQLYQAVKHSSQKVMYLGELSLDGQLKSIKGALLLAMHAKNQGFQVVVLPKENYLEVSILKGIKIIPISNLNELTKVAGDVERLSSEFSHPPTLPTDNTADDQLNFSHVIDQDHAKSALVICAAGGHHTLMQGPPGAGKSMLAKTIPSILPPLNQEQIIEVTMLHSLAEKVNGHAIYHRPFRNPHHTISRSGLIGGGSIPKPGEISLAHHGVLFLDEFPEFKRECLESLRQPIDDGQLSLIRSYQQHVFPSKFILVATANPCPCGYYQTGQIKCKCSPNDRARYAQKFSGPIMDRIDIFIKVNAVKIDRLYQNHKNASDSTDVIKAKITKAQETQLSRYGRQLTNAQLTSQQFKKYCQLSIRAKTLAESASERLQLSTRSFFSLLKVSQTIADLESDTLINEDHVAQALQYRSSF